MSFANNPADLALSPKQLSDEDHHCETLPKSMSLPTEQNPPASDKWGQYRNLPRLYNRSVYPPTLLNRPKKTGNCVQVDLSPGITRALLAKPARSLSAVDTEGYEPVELSI